MLNTILSLAILQATATQTPPPTPAPSPPRCDSEAHGAFDFWVGEWDVYPNGTDNLVAHSKIERLYAGCAIRENWMPLSGNEGGSLSNLDFQTGRWHQTWIGSSPGRVEFEGGSVDGKMVLTGWWPGAGGPSVDGLIRMTYTREDGGAVRQHGELSTDHGVSWQPSFDFIYRPREAGEE